MPRKGSAEQSVTTRQLVKGPISTLYMYASVAIEMNTPRGKGDYNSAYGTSAMNGVDDGDLVAVYEYVKTVKISKRVDLIDQP